MLIRRALRFIPSPVRTVWLILGGIRRQAIMSRDPRQPTGYCLWRVELPTGAFIPEFAVEVDLRRNRHPMVIILEFEATDDGEMAA